MIIINDSGDWFLSYEILANLQDYGIVLIDTMVNYLGTSNVSVLSSYTDHSDSKSMHVD